MFPLFLKRRADDDPPADQPVTFVVGKNGIFCHKQTAVFRATVKASALPMLADVTPRAEYLLPQIPAVLVACIEKFFRAVFKEHRSEAIVLVAYRAGDQEFVLVAPEQVVTAGRCDYVMPAAAPEGFTFVGTVHSHGSFSAGHSGTDVNDEQFFDGIHVTFGRVDEERFDLSCCMAVSGTRFPQETERVLGGVRKIKPEPYKPPAPEPILTVPEPVASAEPILPEDYRDTEPPEPIAVQAPNRGFFRALTEKFLGPRPQPVKTPADIVPKRRRARVNGNAPVARAPRVYTPTYYHFEREGYVVDLPEGTPPQATDFDPAWMEKVKKPVYQYQAVQMASCVSTPGVFTTPHTANVGRVDSFVDRSWEHRSAMDDDEYGFEDNYYGDIHGLSYGPRSHQRGPHDIPSPCPGLALDKTGESAVKPGESKFRVIGAGKGNIDK